MRAFVIGNGYSLAKTNLELLHNEVTFACNRISKIYDKVSFRPTHYVRAEEAGTLDTEEYIEDMELHIGMCEVWANPYFSKKHPDLKYNRIDSCAHYATNYDEDNCPHLWHLPKLCTFGSSVNVAVQIAHLQGFSPIYLIGCDLGYKDNEPSHFTDDYEEGLKDLRPARYANLNTLAAHMVASRMGLEIYNATIGGDLEVYERKDYDGLF